ncbi:MAG: hypothetical protein L3K14_08910 [Thermoplasmata archaeon]|nr:hypothetical protein [Thermoplasmata archaeon]
MLERPGSVQSIESTLRPMERRLAQFDRTISRTEFELYSGRSSHAPERWITTRARFLGREELRDWVESAKSRVNPDTVLGRRLELLNRLHLDAASEQHPSIVRLRTRLQRRIIAFRPRFQGRRVSRARIYDELRSNPDAAAREEAYRAEDELSLRLEPAVRQLVALRNDRARALGFRDYPELRLRFEGLSVSKLMSLCRATAAPLRTAIGAWRGEFLAATGRNEWFPWDLRFAQERRAALPLRAFPGRSMIPAVRAALSLWGLPMRRLRIRVSRRDIPFAGLTFAVRVPSDIRILIPPNGGWEWYVAGFHEFGHAVHFSLIRQTGHLLRSTDVGFSGFVEGIADLFEELALNPRWLEGRRGLNSSTVRAFRVGRSLEHVVRAAITSNWVATELDLYRKPQADPALKSSHRLREQFGFGTFVPRSFLQVTYVTHPVYDQSYLLSLLFRKQLVHALSEQVGDPLWPNPRAGPWLAEKWFAPGARFDWIPRVREVTGRPFGAGAFLESVRGGEP